MKKKYIDDYFEIKFPKKALKLEKEKRKRKKKLGNKPIRDFNYI